MIVSEVALKLIVLVNLNIAFGSDGSYYITYHELQLSIPGVLFTECIPCIHIESSSGIHYKLVKGVVGSDTGNMSVSDSDYPISGCWGT